jgi:hypothetical protein
MRRILSIAVIGLMALFVGFACVGSVYAHDYTVHTGESEIHYVAYAIPKVEYVLPPEDIIILDDGDPESDIPLLRDFCFVKLTEDECNLLLDIAMAEAEGEDAKGKALVMRVVLNRSLEWEQTIEEVIFKPNQFATYRMGITPSENCHEALSMVVEGWDESEGALYFNAGKYSNYGEPLFQYGGHCFSR